MNYWACFSAWATDPTSDLASTVGVHQAASRSFRIGILQVERAFDFASCSSIS